MTRRGTERIKTFTVVVGTLMCLGIDPSVGTKKGKGKWVWVR